MRKHLSSILLILVFLIGLSVLLYPTISNYLNQINASHAVVNYDETLSRLAQEEYDRLLDEASAYNLALAARGREMIFLNGAPQDARYQGLLDVDGSGMIGYVTIEKLGVQLPVMHGTDESTLSQYAGHLEGSSLPIGGASTHTVLTGHRGLPAAKLFTDLDQLELGDTFTLSTLNETLTYEVDDIKIVLPEDAGKIEILPGGDYATLITCTPYGVNTHRLLVRGVRTDAPSIVRVAADLVQIDPLIVAPVVATPMLLILLIILLVNGNRRKKRGKAEKNPAAGKDSGIK